MMKKDHGEAYKTPICQIISMVEDGPRSLAVNVIHEVREFRLFLKNGEFVEYQFRYYTTNSVNALEKVYDINSNVKGLFFSDTQWRPLWSHDDVIKWKLFPRYWPFVRGFHRSPVNSPHKGQWRVALMFSLICVWINCWVNNRKGGDLRRYRSHYDVTVM